MRCGCQREEESLDLINDTDFFGTRVNNVGILV